ncbi:MAG: hypothetical protein JW829_14050 [Pirellulales bacterium]|nr:hypothetical protein [Pirellulales bacterium]
MDGGDDDDLLAGDAGADRLFGGQHDDTISGGTGNDMLIGQGGNDLLDGEEGDDSIFGIEGTDIGHGGLGIDRMHASAGTHQLHGGDGNDLLFSREGSQHILYGDGGNDRFYLSSSVDDWAYGGDGNDFFYACISSQHHLDGECGEDLLITRTDANWLHGGDGNDDIRVLGSANGNMLYGDAGDDVIQGGQGNDEIHGGSGNDTLHGSAGNDWLSGDTGEDILFGDAGSDTLLGGDATDQLHGGEGDDTLEGGLNGPHSWSAPDIVDGESGNDTYLATTGAQNTRFLESEGDDLYVFSGSNLGSVQILPNPNTGAGGTDALDFSNMNSGISIALASNLPQNVSSGFELYLRNDSASEEYANIENVIGTQYNDHILGNSLPNLLHGRGGVDTIRGYAGNDLLDGGSNDATSGTGDQLYGGIGNDVLLVGSGASRTTVYEESGSDTFRFQGTDLGIVTIEPNSNDTGDDEDILDFSGMTSSVAVSLASSIPQMVNDDLSLELIQIKWHVSELYSLNLDHIFGTIYNDHITGNDLANQLDGGFGNDQLLGLDGNDWLIGGEGDDTLLGGLGKDYLEGNDGNDSLHGGDHNDFLDPGSNTIQDMVFGESGDDIYLAGHGILTEFFEDTGDDCFRFHENSTGTVLITSVDAQSANGTDTLDFSSRTNAPIHLDLGANLLQDLSEGLHLRILNESWSAKIENVIGTIFDDTIIGNQLDNSLLGGAGNDFLVGGGNTGGIVEILDGGEGDDQFVVSGNSVTTRLIEDAGNDTFHFCSGSLGRVDIEPTHDILASTQDTLDFHQMTAPITLSLVDGLEQNLNACLVLQLIEFTDEANEIRPVQIENVVGTAYADQIMGNDLINEIWGGDGDDTIQGGDANDTLWGEDGNDTLEGDAGDDSLDGGPGGQTIMDGGLGDDWYVVHHLSATSIQIVEIDQGGKDAIDLSQAMDPEGAYLDLRMAGPQNVFQNVSLNLSETTIGHIEIILGTPYGDCLHGNAANNLICGHGGADHIYGEGGNDILYGGIDDDWLHGGPGNDMLLGSSGHDFLFGDEGNDYLEGGFGDDALTGGEGEDGLDGGFGTDVFDETGYPILHFTAGNPATQVPLGQVTYSSPHVSATIVQEGVEPQNQIVRVAAPANLVTNGIDVDITAGDWTYHYSKNWMITGYSIAGHVASALEACPFLADTDYQTNTALIDSCYVTQIEFIGNYAQRSDVCLIVTADAVTSEVVQSGMEAADAIQTISADTSVPTGYFSLGYAGAISQAIPASATGIEVEMAVESVSGCDVEVIQFGPGTWEIRFPSMVASDLTPMAAGPNTTIHWGDNKLDSIAHILPLPPYSLNTTQQIDLFGNHTYDHDGVHVIEIAVDGASDGIVFNPTYKFIACIGSIDSDNDGISDNDELGIGTNPFHFDTDGDLLPDGFEEESEYLDPIVPDDPQGDPDGDDLTNLDELIHNTDPDLADTDGDGINDREEIDQGSDPNDPADGGIAPPGERIVALELNVGDDSGSHSERWELNVGKIAHQSPDFGILSGWTEYKYEKGMSYDITLDHLGSNIRPPDYDWYAGIRLATGEDTLIVIENPPFSAADGATLRLLGYPSDSQHENVFDNVNDAAGKKACLHIPLVDLDVILPDGEALADALETNPGGFISQNDEDLLELVIHRLSPETLHSLPGTFTITFSSDRIRLWKNEERTEEILSGSTELEIYLDHRLYVQGICESLYPIDTFVQITYDPGVLNPAIYTILGTDASDTVRLTVASVDLDIDSNNHYGLERNADEENIEDDASLPGKFVPVNRGDADTDGIIDFADGYNWDGMDSNEDDRANHLVFVPLVLELSAGLDLSATQIMIDYNASDPLGVSLEEGVLSLPADGGNLRLWTKGGSTQRVPHAANATSNPGDFVAPGDYRPDQLGFNDSTRSVTLYVEGIRPSASLGDNRITVKIDPDGSSGPAGYDLVDAVRVTNEMLDLAIDGLGETWESEPGAIIWRNSDFSKKIEADNQSESGLTLYQPDYANSDLFDGAFQTDYTPATLDIAPWMIDTYQIRFLILDQLSGQDNIVLWTFTQWNGVESVPSTDPAAGPWEIPSGTFLTPTTEHLDFWIEGLENSTCFGFPHNSLEVLALPLESQDFPWYEDEVKYTVVETNAAVDGNRDGTIDFTSSHDRQLIFWYNNDRETLDENGYEREDPASSGYDSDDNLIEHRRDLEDFACLQTQISPVLQSAAYDTARGGTSYRNQLQVTYQLLLQQDGGSYINLFHAASSNPLAHVNDESAVGLQMENHSNEAAAIFVGQWQFLGAPGITPYLFETAGTGPTCPKLIFSTTVEYPNGSTTEKRHGIDLELHDFTDFYDRYRIPYTDGQRHEVDFSTFDAVHFADAVPVHLADVDGSPFFSADENIVLVHGWNMPAEPGNDWKKAFAETAFKRLYWQGYAGRLIKFDWPTYYDAEGPRDWPIVGEAANFTYNPSEYIAYRSGRALMNHLASLPGTTILLAHSMGNVVVAEALRQWNATHPNEPLVDSYVSMQSAISAGVYEVLGNDAFDINFTENLAWIHDIHSQSRVDLNRQWWSGFPNAPGLAQPYMSGTESAAEQWINMYNPDDFATGLAWKLNNLMKHFLNAEIPDIPDLPGIGDDAIWDYLSVTYGFDIHDNVWCLMPPPEIWPYRYLPYLDEINGHQYFRIPYTTVNEWNVDPALWTNLTEGLQSSNMPFVNTYEIIAFLSQANAAAVGIQAVPLWFDVNKDITHLGLNIIDRNSPLYSGTRSNHSFQFHHDSATTWDFWNYIKQQTLFDGSH